VPAAIWLSPWTSCESADRMRQRFRSRELPRPATYASSITSTNREATVGDICVQIPPGLLGPSVPTLCGPRDEELAHLGDIVHIIDDRVPSMLRGSLSVQVSRETPLPPLTLVS
jgi:hypothetical protein